MTTTPILDIVSIDYLRLATFDFKTYCDLFALVRRKYTGWRVGRWAQYKMERSQDNVSYGLAQQKGKPHGIFEASGVDAHIFANWLVAQKVVSIDTLYCTRLDLQSTKRIEPRPDYVKMHKRVARPKKLMLGDDGNTLYIGNRESDSFWRIYDKSAPEFIRVEAELKGKQARGGWLFLRHKMDCIHELYAAHLRKSRVPSFLVNQYVSGITPTNLDDLVVAVPVDLESKLLWLQSLDSLVFKLANDHDLNGRTRKLIERWSEYCQDLDKMPTDNDN